MSQTIELTPMEEQPPVPMRTSDTQEQFNVKTQNLMISWGNNVTIWNNNLPALNTGLNAAVAVVYALPDIQTIIPEIENIAAVAGVATDVADVAAIKNSVVSCADNLPAINAAPGAAESAAQSAADAAATAASLNLPTLTASDTGKTLVWDGQEALWKTTYVAPVGAMTLLPDDIPEPEGWLRCNGGNFGASYPKLAEVLGGTILPLSPPCVVDVSMSEETQLPSMGIKQIEIDGVSGDIWALEYTTSGYPRLFVQRNGTGDWITVPNSNANYAYTMCVDSSTHTVFFFNGTSTRLNLSSDLTWTSTTMTGLYYPKKAFVLNGTFYGIYYLNSTYYRTQSADGLSWAKIDSSSLSPLSSLLGLTVWRPFRRESTGDVYLCTADGKAVSFSPSVSVINTGRYFYDDMNDVILGTDTSGVNPFAWGNFSSSSTYGTSVGKIVPYAVFENIQDICITKDGHRLIEDFGQTVIILNGQGDVGGVFPTFSTTNGTRPTLFPHPSGDTIACCMYSSDTSLRRILIKTASHIIKAA